MLTALAAALAYLIATRALARNVFNPDADNSSALRIGLLGALLHGALHARLWWLAGGADLHFFAALSLVALGMAGLTSTLGRRQRLDTLGVVVFPLAALAALALASIGDRSASTDLLDWRIGLHAWLALLAYATLALAALLAIMLWLQERALRARQFTRLLRALPPLTQLETLLFRTISVGFVLLTLTLITGAVFVENLFAQHLVHKTVLSILSWALFGILLLGRHLRGWRGRRAVRFTLSAMLLLLLAFFGSKLVLEMVLMRG
ncbi:MAG: cytochrome c biogenesis protein CcsA [Xanthomonadales bacterium]|nr:cytochrome c biogenesis protein CcsA [Xanthomonadales bacterium]